MSGKFITIEGLDGCGKSTHVKLLADWLKDQGYKVVCTDEPTDGPMGKLLKRILVGEFKVPVEVEVLLFAADRMQHLSSVILPAIEDGKIVLNERYVHSSMVYQTSRGATKQMVEKANEHALKPDLAILIDVPAEAAISRIKKERKLDEFEKDLKLQRAVRRKYLGIARPGGLKVVKGNRPLEKVQTNLRELLAKVL